MSPGFFSFPTFHHTTRVVHSRAIVQCNAALCELYAFSSHLPRINHKYLKSFTIPRATARSQPRGISPFSQRARLTAQMGTECKTKKKNSGRKLQLHLQTDKTGQGLGVNFCVVMFFIIFTPPSIARLWNSHWTRTTYHPTPPPRASARHVYPEIYRRWLIALAILSFTVLCVPTGGTVSV